jgi:hypothetical protein
VGQACTQDLLAGRQEPGAGEIASGGTISIGFDEDWVHGPRVNEEQAGMAENVDYAFT